MRRGLFVFLVAFGSAFAAAFALAHPAEADASLGTCIHCGAYNRCDPVRYDASLNCEVKCYPPYGCICNEWGTCSVRPPS